MIKMSKAANLCNQELSRCAFSFLAYTNFFTIKINLSVFSINLIPIDLMSEASLAETYDL